MDQYPAIKYTTYWFSGKKMEILLRLISSFFFCKAKGLKLTFLATYFFFSQISSMQFGIQSWRFAKYEQKLQILSKIQRFRITVDLHTFLQVAQGVVVKFVLTEKHNLSA